MPCAGAGRLDHRRGSLRIEPTGDRLVLHDPRRLLAGSGRAVRSVLGDRAKHIGGSEQPRAG